MLVRDLINGGERTSLEFERKQGEVMDITPENAVEKFLNSVEFIKISIGA